MGLVKRGTTWWMSFMYQGQQVRRSTETADKRLAEAILGKIKVQIVEGRFFEKPQSSNGPSRNCWTGISKSMPQGVGTTIGR